MKNFLATVALTILLPLTVNAEQSREFGNYVVHYSAFPADQLTPEIAKYYQISRSKNRAVVNISILKRKDAQAMGTAVRARIRGEAKNLSEQLRKLKMREISEENAIYYIGEMQVNDGETLIFSFLITPEGETTPYQLSFQEQFFTN